MKRGTGTLAVLLAAGCIAISGCGAASELKNTQEQVTDVLSTDIETAEIPDTGEQAAQGSGDITNTDLAPDNNTADQDDTGKDRSYTGLTSDEVLGLGAFAPPAPGTDISEGDSLNTDGEVHSFVGIIVDATPHSLSAQSSLGNIFYLDIPESGVQGNLNYITVGQLATITYTGALDESHATLVGLSDSSLITGIYVEEYAFAIKIINAVKTMNKDALINLTNFPVFLDAGGDQRSSVDSADTLRKMESEKLFTEDLVERMGNYNLFDLQYTSAGFVMGNGGPNITFDVDDDGILGIIGINSVSR